MLTAAAARCSRVWLASLAPLFSLLVCFAVRNTHVPSRQTLYILRRERRERWATDVVPAGDFKERLNGDGSRSSRSQRLPTVGDDWPDFGRSPALYLMDNFSGTSWATLRQVRALLGFTRGSVAKALEGKAKTALQVARAGDAFTGPHHLRSVWHPDPIVDHRTQLQVHPSELGGARLRSRRVHTGMRYAVSGEEALRSSTEDEAP